MVAGTLGRLLGGKLADMVGALQAFLISESQQRLPLADTLGLVIPEKGGRDDVGREERFVERVLEFEAAGGCGRERERRLT